MITFVAHYQSIVMKRTTSFGILSAALLALCMVCFSGCKCSSKCEKELYKINHFEGNPYVAEVWWGDDYDPEYATEALNKKYNVPQEQGGCSSWRKGNLHGRNIDWMMRDYASLIIHLPKSEKVKYASVGIIAGNPAVNKDFIDENEVIPEELRAVLPASVVDGINECGVTINHNIVPYEGAPYETDGDLASVMVCRYVLDNCATAAEAIELLKSKKVTQAVVKLAHDYSHFFISDPTNSYVVEWINKEFVATEFNNDGNGNFISKNGQTAIMTNYFVALAEKYGFKTNDFFKAHRMGAGIERAEIVDSLIKTAETVEDHLAICKAVWYRPFCLGLTNWITENSGNYGYSEEKGKAYWTYPDGSNIHWMDNDDVYAAAKELFASEVMTDYYADFKANGDTLSKDNSYWYTQHSVVYDIDARKGYIIAQEGLNSADVIEITVD